MASRADGRGAVGGSSNGSGRRRPCASEIAQRRGSSRGFVYYDLWITVAVAALAVVIIVPNVTRAVHKSRLRRAEVAAVTRIAAEQAAYFTRHHAYLDSLPIALPAGIRPLTISADSGGWSVAVVGDSGLSTQVACGAYEGPPTLAPNPMVTAPGRVACW